MNKEDIKNIEKELLKNKRYWREHYLYTWFRKWWWKEIIYEIKYKLKKNI